MESNTIKCPYCAKDNFPIRRTRNPLEKGLISELGKICERGDYNMSYQIARGHTQSTHIIRLSLTKTWTIRSPKKIIKQKVASHQIYLDT